MPRSPAAPIWVAPIWLMGLSNSSFGMYGGFITFSLPQLLAEQHVPEARLAAITAVAASPGFYSFLLSPMLDVRFSRRWYATVFAALAAILLSVAIANLTNLALLEAAMLAGFFAVNLSTSALGGWFSTVTNKQDENRLSSWYNVANIGTGGLMALIAAEVVHHLPSLAAAILLGALVFLPTAIFLLIPAPGPDRRLASESFPAFFGEVFSLLRRRQVLIALLLFGAPASTFTLTNILGGLGEEFHCSPRMISVLGGGGMAFAGFFGSLLFPLLARRIALRPLYVAIGFVGSIFTLCMIAFPHTPGSFALAYVGENVFQSLAFTGLFAISFQTIGRHSPLAATTFSLLFASAMVPIVYMQVVDGRAYSAGGMTATYAVDGGIGVAACLLLALFLRFNGRKQAKVVLANSSAAG